MKMKYDIIFSILRWRKYFFNTFSEPKAPVGVPRGREITLFVSQLLSYGWAIRAEIYRVGSGRVGERLAKISADSIEK